MRKTLGLAALWLYAAISSAHPPVGIVQDSRGNVFFTDSEQVWKIAPDGATSVAVPNVHTHELSIDADDRLCGDHLWYTPGAGGKWFHRGWSLQPDGALRDVVPAREGFPHDYSQVRDRQGAMYWADPDERRVIRKRAPDGAIVAHATADFRALGWMTARADGTLYVMDAGDLLRIAPDGAVTRVATRLSSRTPPPRERVEPHYHMGLWTDRTHVYVAVAAERTVVRVDAEGRVDVAARSPAPWAPSGGLVGRDGDLWLLEYDPRNHMRVRRVAPDGGERIFAGMKP